MKKILAAIMVLCLCLSFCSCDSGKKDPLKDVKASTDEYVKKTISNVIATSNGTGLTEEQIMKTLVVTYSDEEINGDAYSYMATYRITLGGSYYYYEFDVSGMLSGGQANVSLSNYYDEPSGSDTNYAQAITINEKKEIAEEQAIKEIIRFLKSTPGYMSYDVDSSKYKIGTISQGTGTAVNHFTVNGTLYLYDKYGSLDDTATFSVTVVVDDYGSYNVLKPRVD